MKLEARFTFNEINHEQDNDNHLVIGLTAPKIDWQSKRPPICVNLVLDNSGSMDGEKLDYVKKSVDKLIEHLQPGDFCSVVVFESNVQVVSPPVEITQFKKDELKAKVSAIQTMGSTNLSGGMLQGLEFANKADLPSNVVNRVILLTDGQANVGISDKAQLVQVLAQNLGKATLSAFGYGRDADQELLANLAKTGKGNYAFIDNPDKAISTFAKELGGLLSMYAQNIEIHVEPHNGHKITEVVSDVDVTEDNGKITVKLPEILSEETRNIILAMKLSKQNQALPRAMNVADIKVMYELIDASGKKEKKSEETKARVTFVKAGDEQTKPTAEVDAVVGIAELVKRQLEAENFAKAGDYTSAQGAMDKAAWGFERRGLHAHAKAARATGGRMASHSLFAANAGYLASNASAGTRSVGTSGMDDAVQMQYEAMGMCDFVSPAQAGVMGSFNANAAPPVPSVKVEQKVIVSAPPARPKKQEKKSSLSKKRSSRW